MRPKRHIALLVIYDLVNLPIAAIWVQATLSGYYERSDALALWFAPVQVMFVVAINLGLLLRRRWAPLIALVHALLLFAMAMVVFVVPQCQKLWSKAPGTRGADMDLFSKIIGSAAFSLPLLVFGLIAFLAVRAMRAPKIDR